MAALTPYLPQSQQVPNLHNPHLLATNTPLEPPGFNQTRFGSQQLPSAHFRSESLHQSRMSGDQRNVSATNGTRNGPVPVPVRPQNQIQMTNGQLRNGSGIGPYEHQRSPPSKNTSHVPCKFFKQGACQAGKACPFMHSSDATTDQMPCKYFAKGSCKFGPKCALAHVLPSGRRVNRPAMHMAAGHGGGNLNLGGRVIPENYHNQQSALSLLQANRSPPTFGSQYPFPAPDDYPSLHGRTSQNFDNIPTIETGYTTSQPGSAYGSPRDDLRLPLSPMVKGLSVLDAPFPASFDSQGISYLARHGPVAASVPTKFGLDSPPPSMNLSNGPATDALKSLHDSAFGIDRNKHSGMPSSPPASDDYTGRRLMHSERNVKPKIVSSSLPRQAPSDEWENGQFLFEEDFVPGSLSELLTPQEKIRRLSRTEEDYTVSHQSVSGVGTPGDSSSKVGSPTTSSPSRFGPLFTRHKKEDDNNNSNPVSGLGHVGSPLRNSSLYLGSSPISALRTVGRSSHVSGDISPYLASPPRQSSINMISQQLQRTRLQSGAGDASIYTQSGRLPSNTVRQIVSSGGMSASRYVHSIDEEQGDLVFPMEDEDIKRYSGGWNYPVGGRSPHLGATGGGRNGSIGADSNSGKELMKEMETLYGAGH
ncbi:MAG: hypothetical protein M1829_006830 [Trizodia sp. TS-e1964]|nr:MAG: hypothetical protein M1829_006830 [Trizodia sp. TS-e1964]